MITNIIFILYFIISLIIIGYLIKLVYDLINKQKAIEKFNITYQDDIVSNVLQIVAYDYHVRAIRCGYGEIMDHDTGKYMRFNKTIQWKCFELGSSLKDQQYTINFYEEKKYEYLVYAINFRLFGNYYIAYGNNPLIAWAVVIKTARAENRKIFSRYPDRQKIK